MAESKCNNRKCLSCKYVGNLDGKTTPVCDYILVTRMARGCDIENCDKYVKSKKRKKYDMSAQMYDIEKEQI